MAVVLISAEDCDAVRAALDVSLTDEMVPDNTVLMDIFAGSADREVRSSVPNIELRSDDELRRLRAATIYYTAAAMIYALPQLIAENIGGYHYQIKSVPPAERMLQLRAYGDGELNSVLNDPLDDTPNMPTMFTVACGFRGR